MFRVIGPLDWGPSIMLLGKPVPKTSILEDEDGMRILWSESQKIKASDWLEASAMGVRGLLTQAGPEHQFVTVEKFLEHRTEMRAEHCYALDGKHWTGVTPSRYFDMLASTLRSPNATSGFVHLHAHSEFSPLDGMSTVQEMVDAAVADGNGAIAVTDHGYCAAHAELSLKAEKAGIKPIFGLEANFVNNRLLRGTPGEKEGPLSSRYILGDYFHLILWASTNEGLKNLWAMSTEANQSGFYGRPRIDWELLDRYGKGIMCSTACLRGPLAQDLLQGRDDLANQTLGRLLGIFGDGLFIELHTNQVPDQLILNERLVDLSEQHGLPTIAVVDSHYPCADFKQTHEVWLAAQTGTDLTSNDSDLFAGNHDYHIMVRDEVAKAMHYLPEHIVTEAIDGTQAVADRCNAKIVTKKTAPIFSKKGGAQRDVERLVDICIANWSKVAGRSHPESEYMDRFEEEMSLIREKGFCGYFLIVSDYVMYAKKNGILVGPGRGSGAGSLVAYLCGITEVDPIEHDLLFERFLTKGRTELPDFDVDFPSTKREFMQDYVRQRYGDDFVLRIGTRLRLKNKGTVKTLARVLKGVIDINFTDIEQVSKIIDQAEAGEAGLGLSWDDLWNIHGDQLMPYRERYPLLFEHADKMVGRLKSYGKHPAGIVISMDEPLTGNLPLRSGEGDYMVSEFSHTELAALDYIKFDFLTIRNLDTLQTCIDLIKERTGVLVTPYEWVDEYLDRDVWADLGMGHTMGCFQIETSEGTKHTKMFKPTTIAHLSDVITLIRPGPKRSGLTDQYFRRKSGAEPVTLIDDRLGPVLSKSFGCILYQEDVMNACKVLGGYSGEEADQVRSILGKKKVEAIRKEATRFVDRCSSLGMRREDADFLFSQIEEFAKYSFNRSHAVSYAIIGYWCAWMKYHYPLEFMTALMSTVDKERIPECVTEARRLGIKVLPPDINLSGKGFTMAGDNEIRYGLDGIKGIGEKAVEAITIAQPYTSVEDFLSRKGSAANAGVVMLLARIGAFDSLSPNRRALEVSLELRTDGQHEMCKFKDSHVTGPGGLPCTFDWDSEPLPLTSKGKPGKRKPPPKKCTKACRQYSPLGESALAVDLEPYTDEDIRQRESEMLGLYLSSTPFDRIDDEVRDQMLKVTDIELRGPGEYTIAAVVKNTRSHRDKTGKQMGFLDLTLEDGELSCVVFKAAWAKWKQDLIKGRLILANISVNDRGSRLINMQPL